MNIFFLDEDIETSAKQHVDKHVVKMRVELAQLASAAHWMTDSSAPYKLTHKNHPCAVWTRESISNYNYIVRLGLALCDELDFRWGKKQQKARFVLQWLSNNKPLLPDVGFTMPPLAFGDEYKLVFKPEDFVRKIDYVVENYRNYYNEGKTHLHLWTNRHKPNWSN